MASGEWRMVWICSTVKSLYCNTVGAANWYRYNIRRARPCATNREESYPKKQLPGKKISLSPKHLCIATIFTGRKCQDTLEPRNCFVDANPVARARIMIIQNSYPINQTLRGSLCTGERSFASPFILRCSYVVEILCQKLDIGGRSKIHKDAFYNSNRFL